MNLEILSQNVRRLRTAKRLSQKGLADASGVSLPSIKALEGTKSQPRMSTVQSIAKALDVKMQDMFMPVRELRSVRFRSSKRMQNRENILAGVSRWLDDYNYLEEVLDKRSRFSLDKARKQCSRDNIIAAAAQCRKKLGLDNEEPIYDICGLLESAGVKIRSVPMASDSFFGLSIGEDDGGPGVVVNAWERIVIERQIFSAVHELAHLMLHLDAFDVSKTEESKEEEIEANLFASHFLMPDDGFRKEWNAASGLHRVDRVFKVKRIFNVSYKTVLFRLIDHNVADKSIWQRFQVSYQERFNRRLNYKEEPMALDSAEPFGLRRFDFYEDRFSRLVREALETEKISMSRGAEMLGIGIVEMQDLLHNWEAIL